MIENQSFALMVILVRLESISPNVMTHANTPLVERGDLYTRDNDEPCGSGPYGCGVLQSVKCDAPMKP